VSEADCGIEVYLTATPGTGGRIKAEPEDFVIEEIASPPPRDEGGKFTAAVIRSRNWETNRLVREMARNLRVSRQRIAFAGTKDKRSVATRLFTFEMPLEELSHLHLADVDVLDAFPTARAVEIGDLRGNRFRIVVRGMAVTGEDGRRIIEKTLEPITRAGGFPNFFGLQRFGSRRPVTHLVGRHIVRGDFEEAVRTYVANPIEGEGEEAFDAREALERTGDYRAALDEYPESLGLEKAVINVLVQRPGDFVGALKALPWNLLMMFVHAYQSYLFNRMLSERIRRDLSITEPVAGDLVLPVRADGLVDRERWVPVGEANLERVRTQCRAGKAFVSASVFGAESSLAGGPMGEIENNVLEEEGVAAKDFIVPRVPRLSSKGTRRELACPLTDLSVAVQDDTATFAFSLPRGSYATCFLREVLKDEAGLR